MKQPWTETVMAGALTLMLAGTAQAWGCPCCPIQGFMAICCPKPCPVFDASHLAEEVMKAARERDKLTRMMEHGVQGTELSQVMGKPGERAQAAPVCDGHAPVIEHTDAEALDKVVEQPREERRTEHLKTKMRTLADTEILIERTVGAIDALSERGAKAGAAAQGMRDVRDGWRAVVEMRQTRLELERLTERLRYARGRIRWETDGIRDDVIDGAMREEEKVRQ